MSGLGAVIRPGQGQITCARFTAVFAEETIYPNDWVCLSATAPSVQGTAADGVVEGQTLLSSDYIYALLAIRSTGEGLQLGVSMGASLDAVGDVTNVLNDSVAADNFMVVQNWGVHPSARTNLNATRGKDELTMDAAIAGSSKALEMPTGADPETFLGMCLSDDSAYTRAVADTACAAFVRCNW